MNNSTKVLAMLSLTAALTVSNVARAIDNCDDSCDESSDPSDQGGGGGGDGTYVPVFSTTVYASANDPNVGSSVASQLTSTMSTSSIVYNVAVASNPIGLATSIINSIGKGIANAVTASTTTAVANGICAANPDSPLCSQ